jgi:hypothetical protein
MSEEYYKKNVNKLSGPAKKVFESLSKDKQKKLEGGVGNDRAVTTGASIERNENAVYLIGNNKENNLISIGTDAELADKGYEATNISIIAGFSKHERLASEFKELETTVFRPLDIEVDCATLEVSQLTNADSRLSLADGSSGNITKVSAIIGKADVVRLVGENGIKLVTAKSNINSRNAPHYKIKGIDLIGGNDDSLLQPIAKGQNTIDCIDQLSDIVNDLINYTMQIVAYQAKANIQTAGHIHQESSGEVTFEGFTPFVAANMAAANQFSDVIYSQLDSLKKRIDVTKDLFINNPTSPTNIMSPYNNTN